VAIPRSTVELFHELLAVSIKDLVPSRRILARDVAWDSTGFTVVPFDAIVCDASALASALIDGLDGEVVNRDDPGSGGYGHSFFLRAHGRVSVARGLHAGSRRAIGGWIEDLPNFDITRSLIAAVPGGWLFGVGHPEQGIALVLVHPATHDDDSNASALVGAIRYLWPGHESKVRPLAQHAISVAPIFDPQCAARGELAIGNRAFTIDPLRGDGVGYALRGALLAHSVLAAISSGREPAPYLAYYRARLSDAFCTHVRACISHYKRAWNAAIWAYEIDDMSQCLSQISPHQPHAFHLRGRDLVPA